MKKRYALLTTALATAMILGGGYLSQNETHADSYQQVELNDQNQPKSSITKGIASHVPFKVKTPANLPEGVVPGAANTQTYEQNGKRLTVVQQGWLDKDKDKKLKYQQKELLITQSSDDGSYLPTGLLSKAEKITVQGVDAWVLRGDDLHDPVQIMFWKDGTYYNIRGMNIQDDKLLKIAESLS